MNGTSSNTDVHIDENNMVLPPIEYKDDRFPFCIVWTPIPILTWLLPMIGHMGIGMSNGVIRDFAGSYFVSEDNMAFGRPTRYLRLHYKHVEGGAHMWDESVSKASTLYSGRMHNLFCDNCHSHVAAALNGMHYKQRTNYGMVKLALWIFIFGRYVGLWGFVKTWLPFVIVLVICATLGYYV